MTKQEIKDLEKKIITWKNMSMFGFGDYTKEIAEAEAKIEELKQQKNINIVILETKADTVEADTVDNDTTTKADTVDNDTVDNEYLGEDTTDKRYYQKNGKPILLPINSEVENVKNKRVSKLNESILIYLSNFQNEFDVEEYDQSEYDQDRYIYENRIIKNKELVEQYSKTKINTFIRNVRKLAKIEGGIISVEQHKGENIYRIDKGEKYVLIERKILEVLIDAFSNNAIKTYIFLHWRVGTKGGIVSRKEIAQNIGMSTSGQRQLTEITNIIKSLENNGLIRKELITLDSMENGNKYNRACFYEVVPYEEWIKFWNRKDK